MKPASTKERARALSGAGEQPSPSPPRTGEAEPRTGVVRKLEEGERPLTSQRSTQSGISEIVARAPGPRPRARTVSRERRPWRCLEWPAMVNQRSELPSQRPASASPEVSIAQHSNGNLQRQSGPAEWLPEAAVFMHRLASKVGESLGFSSCRTLCLRASTQALAVNEASSTTIMSVTGPLRHMSNVLRRAGLE